MAKIDESKANIIKAQFKGNIGMFLVCVELSKHNLIAMPTSRNTKGYDIVVLHPETNITSLIQVKCTDKKDFPVLNSHWKNYITKIEEKILADFVFVDISEPDKPNYFILSQQEMKDTMSAEIQRYLQKYQQKHNLNFKQVLEKEEKEKRKPNLWTLKLSDIEGYKDNWDTITNSLYKQAIIELNLSQK